LDDDKDRQPTKTQSRGQYRRREDQYLCIEIQPESDRVRITRKVGP